MQDIEAVAAKNHARVGTSLDAAALQRRATWLRILMKWHWISSALSLIGMLFFAATGITLNNADTFENPVPVITKHAATLPQDLLSQINAKSPNQDRAVPESLRTWVRATWGIALSPKSVDWRDEELFIDLKRPGVDAWLSVDRKTGAVQYEADDRGWVAFFNDLHKGKNAGQVWSWLINLLGAGFLVFSITGLLILQVHAKSRWSIWPITGLGLVLPLLALLLFVH